MRKSEKLLTDNELFKDEIEQRIDAWKSGTCIKCGTKINKSKMTIGHLEIYEQSGICDICFEKIFNKILPDAEK